MTQTPATSNNASPAAAHPASPHRAAHTHQPPRQQAETSAARERFAARLERSQAYEHAIDERGDDNPPADARGRVQRDPSEDSERADTGNDRSGDPHADLALAQSAAVLHGVAGVTGIAASTAALPIDPKLFERIAAQIAEHWPAGLAQAARIQFPPGMLVTAALLTREPDGSMAIRLTGLDPRITAVQSARLQHDLANALSRRRLRVGSLQFDDAARVQRGGVRPGSGADSAIDRVV
jgi:hypothetical protein